MLSVIIKGNRLCPHCINEVPTPNPIRKTRSHKCLGTDKNTHRMYRNTPKDCPLREVGR